MHNLLLSNRLPSILVACALMSSALLGSSVSHAETCRPFHVDITGQFSDMTFDENQNLVSASVAASGYASNLGAIAAVGIDYFAPPENGLIVVDGNGWFTTVQGDQLFVNFDGTVYDPATGTATGTYVFTGGTGRFEGASGTASLSSGPNSSDPNKFDITAEGTLCY